MKKFVTIALATLVAAGMLTLAGCAEKEALYVLNWGEYMDPALIELFEETYDVDVVYEEVGSNEEMEIKLKQGITDYDIMIPSDYMIDKLYQEGLLQAIDTDKLTQLSTVDFFDDAKALYEDEPFGEAMVPYFFGTVGIMYHTADPDVVTAVTEQGFCALFDDESPHTIGLYDSPRDTVGAALMCLGHSVNSTNESELADAQALLEDVIGRPDQLTRFGEDELKGDVARGNLDMALVYSGDYFEMLFEYEADGAEIAFDYFAPEHTNIWIDAFVIPEASQNPDLAHMFIDFFLDPEHAATNADWVGYTPVIVDVYDTMVDEYGYDYDHYYPQPEGSSREVFLYLGSDHAERLNTILNTVRSD